MKISRWYHSSVQIHLLGILQGIASIADGLVIILSLATFGSNFELVVASYRAKCNHKIMVKNKLL
jgi:hypothetical protein